MPLKPQLLVLLAATAIALYTWCRLSELQPGTGLNQRYAWLLLALAGVLRVVQRALRARALETLSHSIDAYALATLAGLRAPRRTIPPLWPALLLLASLPAERVLQRAAGAALHGAEALAAAAMTVLAAVALLTAAIVSQRRPVTGTNP